MKDRNVSSPLITNASNEAVLTAGNVVSILSLLDRIGLNNQLSYSRRQPFLHEGPGCICELNYQLSAQTFCTEYYHATESLAKLISLYTIVLCGGMCGEPTRITYVLFSSSFLSFLSLVFVYFLLLFMYLLFSIF